MGGIKSIPVSHRTKGTPKGDLPVYNKISFTKISINILSENTLKGTATLMISMFYQKELYEP